MCVKLTVVFDSCAMCLFKSTFVILYFSSVSYHLKTFYFISV